MSYDAAAEPSKLNEKGYLYAYTGELEKGDIFLVINQALNPILKRDIKMEINVVKDRDEKPQGHSFLWTAELDVYNLLLKLNPDGTERVRYEEDPDWEEPDIDLSKITDWSVLAENEPIKIKIEEDPLFTLQKVNDYLIGIEPAFCYEDNRYENSIFCRKVPKWVSNSFLSQRFKIYEKDDNEHSLKGSRFSYPLIERNRDFCKIIFSPIYQRTASFVINMTKKVYFNHQGKNTLLLFKLTEKQRRGYSRNY